MFKKLQNFFKNYGNKSKILYKTPKMRIFSLNPKYLLKRFLRWMRFRNTSGDLLIREETNMNEVFAEWSKILILWLINIFITGFIIVIAISPFMKFTLNFGLLTYIFSFGLLWYVILEAIKDIRNAIKKGV